MNLFIHKKELANIFCQLFLFIFLMNLFTACHSSKKELNEDFYKNYILEDQGAEPNDTFFSFNIYSHDITGDKKADPLFITTYMDNYFGYVFNGETGEEIPQSGWVNFISKPGREMYLEFRDLTCNSGKEIIQYSISGQQNNEVHFDVLSFQNDSLVNVFSEMLSGYDKESQGYFSKPIIQEDCAEAFSLFYTMDSIPKQTKNKIEYIRNYIPIPEKYKYVKNNPERMYLFDKANTKFIQK